MRRQRLVFPVACLAASPLPAAAHLASTGLGPVYDGIVHFALTPEQVLPMAALGLFAGLRGPAQARCVFVCLPLAWLAAALAGPCLAPVAAFACVLASGALLAANLRLPAQAVAVVAGAAGAVLGAAYDRPPGILAAVTTALGVAALLAILASVSLPLRRAPALIAVRVAGSWTAALGLLLIGWWIHAGA
jgi:hypothetical protein